MKEVDTLTKAYKTNHRYVRILVIAKIADS